MGLVKPSIVCRQGSMLPYTNIAIKTTAFTLLYKNFTFQVGQVSVQVQNARHSGLQQRSDDAALTSAQDSSIVVP